MMFSDDMLSSVLSGLSGKEKARVQSIQEEMSKATSLLERLKLLRREIDKLINVIEAKNR